MVETILYLKSGDIKKPVIKVVDNKVDQVVLNFCSRQEHLTLHLQPDGILLRNYWDQDKSKGSWDDERVEVARKLGFKNPEKHGKYIAHNPVGHISDEIPLHLIGRRINLNDAPNDKDKYRKLECLVIDVPTEEIMISFYLYPKATPQDSLGYMRTSLGFIVLKAEN